MNFTAALSFPETLQLQGNAKDAFSFSLGLLTTSEHVA